VQCLLQQPAKRVTLFGVPVDNLTLAETVDRIEEMIRRGPTHQHVVVNVDKIVKLHATRPCATRCWGAT